MNARTVLRAMTSYVELGARSAFSFLEGASEPEILAARAAELELEAVALTDRSGVYGSARFHRAAQARGVRAIVGTRLEVEGLGTVRLLCETQAGYRRLARLLTLGHRGRPKGECRVTVAQLQEHAAGLTCLAGPELHAISLEAAHTLERIFSRDHLAIEVSRHFHREEEVRNRALLHLAEAAKLPAVATGDVRFAHSRNKPLLDVLTCIRHHTTLDRAGRRLLPNAEWRMKSPREMAQVWSAHPQLLVESCRIAERCEFTLENLGYRFPEFPVPPGETPTSYLRALTYAGAQDRYRPLTPKVRRQLDKELALIAKLGLEGYFLIVWDISRWAKENDIMAQGRGSAANSAVCYSLGITAVDPVGMDLLFERFLSEERGEWPDIDIDLPSGTKREAVIQYVYQKYGPHGAAMTANVITYRDRSALREVGKTLGFAPHQVDKVAKLGGRWGSVQEESITERMAAVGLDPKERRTQLWVALSRQLLNLPRHLGQHSGGMVMAQGRLDEVSPIEPATMENRSVVQWDKDDCAALGIIKVDLLGLGMLAALEEAVPLIQQSEGITIDYAHLPPNDTKVYDMLCRADTVGLFQVESRAQMATLPRLRPRCFYDLVIEIALIRPGPITGQMVHPYLQRRQGKEPVTYPHPDLEPVLARTLGVPIFQEQVMRMAMIIAGFSGGEAEELRRAMGFKRSNERMAEIEGRLRSGMRARGIDEATQDQLVHYMTSFASYGFPESHSASFALIAYASAYLKAHHPAAFLAALLNAYPMGFYHPDTLIKDAQRHGVRVRPIDVTVSAWRCTLEDKGTVRLGLRYVVGLHEKTGERIVKERSRAPFTGLVDLERRCRLSDPELQTLAELGAFASLGHSRRQALWQVARLKERTAGLLSRTEAAPGPSPLPEMDLRERIVADHRNATVSVGSHPMRFFRAHLQRLGILSCAALNQKPHGARATVAAFVTVRQRPATAQGLFFLTLEDETGFANLIVMPDVFERFRPLVISGGSLWASGKVQRQDGVVHLKVDALAPLSEVLEGEHVPTPAPQYTRSFR